LIADWLGSRRELLVAWLRRPALDVSEAIMRLRRLRGLTQEELAERIGTQQPAIARIERGASNTTLATLVKLADALGTTVRIDLDPVELLDQEPRYPRWWEREQARNSPVPVALLAEGTSVVRLKLTRVTTVEEVELVSVRRAGVAWASADLDPQTVQISNRPQITGA
jgi:transcriptional regulator with XRE-family HTH domain